MKTILVDDEPWAMKQFERECSSIRSIELVGVFDDSLKALDYAKQHAVEFALLDIEMPDMNGIELSKHLKELHPGIIIVFVTAHEEYFSDFLNVQADYYVMKPYTKKDVESVIERAKLLSARFKKRIYMRTFGRTLFLSLKQDGGSEEREIILRILYAVCDYLQYLYDQKDLMLRQEQEHIQQEKHARKKASSAWASFLTRRGRKWDV